jgi:uncharacterized flavoprotein (TIGR03862 family)
LALAGVAPVVIDGARAPSRKFLLAGRGGLNLTHSEDIDAFLARYGPEGPRLAEAIAALSPTDLRSWSDSLGEPTFVGSSGRVFPKSFKAAPLLRAWLRRLDGLGVTLRLRHRMTGFDAEGRALVATPGGEQAFAADAIVLALGGASWPHLGADGSWTEMLQGQGVDVAPLQPANSGFVVAWSAQMQAFAGKPLKNLALRCGSLQARGEAMITAAGLEGGGIYALSRPLREAIFANGEAILEIDLKPDTSVEALATKLARPAKESISTLLRKGAGLDPPAIALAREPGPLPREPLQLAERIKRVTLRLTAPSPVARAISTAGGVKWSEIDERFMLIKRPGVFVAGEMIDWEAPTGGYLLQACFATGAAAGRGAAAWLSGEQ